MDQPVRPAEPRRSSGGAGGVARADLPPWHGQKVKIPARLWTSGHYSHGAVRYWGQVAALDRPAEGCRAGVVTLAAYLGDSTRTAERYLAELAEPGPDGIPEMTTVRHTHPGGKGATAERRMRPVARIEHFAYVPVTAIKALRPTLVLAYCVLAWAVAVGAPHTAAELGAALGVTVRTARRLVDELEALGWAAVERRAGHQGRHLVTVHDHPIHLVPDLVTDGGSGADTDGGSLASKEDPGLTDTRDTAQVGGAFRRRRDDRKWVGAPVDNSVAPVAPVAATFRPAPPVRPLERPAYAGPALTLSPRVWAVLEPVRDLIGQCAPYTARRIAREIGAQLDNGIWPDDIRDQITRLRAWTPTEDLTDPGRWLLGAVLPPRSRCQLPGCHWGFLAHTGAPCKACAEIATAHPPHTGLARPHACTTCGWNSPTPLPLQRCAACRPTA
ncbi:hypothetical protein [Streptomyces sp. NPDC087856]|uniref:hypothetical protein n=1 Tax=Streptomyces sp. NPDC087856 TaxID=3365811 RepID=UPI00381E0282